MDYFPDIFEYIYVLSGIVCIVKTLESKFKALKVLKIGFWSLKVLDFLMNKPRRGGGGGGVHPFSGLMGTCGQTGYVFRDFCRKQGIDFYRFVLNRVSFLGKFL